MRNAVSFTITAGLACSVLLLTASSTKAIDKCKVKLDKKTGVLRVDASGIVGTIVWGPQSGQETNMFFNAGTCVQSGKAKKCQLADPATLAAKTPPEGCTIYLADDSATDCSAWVRTCTPGVRDLSSATVLPCVSQVGTDVFFDGCNVHVRDGSGDTGGTTNGLGNLIIGYDEDNGDTKTGSHNLIIGENHTYSSYGGLVAGRNNAVAGSNASVTGGSGNAASGNQSSVSGGAGNVASGLQSSVSGGISNIAGGIQAAVTGGQLNEASGDLSWVGGGNTNEASGLFASVSGGKCNTAGPGTLAFCFSSAFAASVSGGLNNLASGGQSSVTGGTRNTASGSSASVSGGANNTASGSRSAVSGGELNTASNKTSTVSGGFLRTAPGLSDWAAGGLFEDF